MNALRSDDVLRRAVPSELLHAAYLRGLRTARSFSLMPSIGEQNPRGRTDYIHSDRRTPEESSLCNTERHST